MKSFIEIRKGKCILSQKPFVCALKSQYRTERCDFCFAMAKVRKCANCCYVYYCNIQCQREAWAVHQVECIYLRKIQPKVLPDAARIMSRIILKLNSGGDYEKGYYTDRKYRVFKDLMSHEAELRADKKRMEHITSLSTVLQVLLGKELLPNETELLAIYGRMLVNAFNILDQEMNSLGTGIYLGVSVLDHSCKPNAIAIFEGTTINIRALEDIPTLDWSKIFISYIDLMNPTNCRQQELEKNYFFLCTCEKCLDPVESMKMNAAACPNTKCNNFLNLQLQSIQNCDKCTMAISNDFILKYNEVMDLTKLHLENMKDIAYLDVCSVMLKKQIGVLHPLNVWHVKTLDKSLKFEFESAINIEKWDEAIEYGTDLLSGFRQYNGDFHPLLGLIYMKLGKILLHKNQCKEALYNLNKANEIIKITHGQNHSLYEKELIPLLLEASN